MTIHFRLGSKKYGKIHVRVIYQYNVTWIGKAMLKDLQDASKLFRIGLMTSYNPENTTS